MGFWSLLLVACMPVLQILLIGFLGVFLASGYVNILSSDACRDINKIVYVVFAPSLMLVSVAKTVSLSGFVSWWFMLVNIGITFLIGGILGSVVVKILKPDNHLKALVIACCSAGNLGNLPLVIIPAICNEVGNPFGDHNTCSTHGLSYVSLSMALGNMFIWTHTYSLMKKSCLLYDKIQTTEQSSKVPNKDPGDIVEAHQCKLETSKAFNNEDTSEHEIIVPLLSSKKLDGDQACFLSKLKEILHQIADGIMTPPVIAAIVGFVVGTMPWLKSLIVGETAPLRVFQESLLVLGAGTIPCVTLILGGNLTQGLQRMVLKPFVIIAIVFVRYVILPISGIIVVKAVGELGFLPQDPLYHYVLMLQFTVPPSMSIGTMVQLFSVGQEECSIIFLWTYLAAAFAITFWSTIFMWILF